MTTHRVRSPWVVSPFLAAMLVTALVLVMSAGLAVLHTATAEDTTVVTLSERNDSGVTGTATVDADGNIDGEASGMDPDTGYVSYVYGAGSSATGNNPCILTGERLVGPINTVGTWEVDEDGNGTLSGKVPARILGGGGTLSVRENDLGTGGLVGPTPLDTLVACGQIGDRPSTMLGNVQDQLPALPKIGGPATGG